MAKLLIARHGETDWNLNGKWQGQSDVPLNGNGIKQANSLALELLDKRIDQIYSSDLSRAFNTAEIISGYLHLGPVQIEKRLRERNFGMFEGMTTTQIADSMDVTRDEVSMLDMDKFPSVEPWHDFLQRISSAIDHISEMKNDRTVLIVAHGGVMRGLHQKFMNGHKPRTFFNNGELMTLEKKDGGWIIQS